MGKIGAVILYGFYTMLRASCRSRVVGPRKNMVSFYEDIVQSIVNSENSGNILPAEPGSDYKCSPFYIKIQRLMTAKRLY